MTSVLSQNKIGFFEWDYKSDSMYLSQGLREVLGHDQTEANRNGREHFLEYVFPAQQNDVNEKLHVASRGKVPLNFDFRVVASDGTTHNLCCRLELSESGTLQQEYVIGIITDISHEKYINKEENTYQQLEDIIEFLPDATFAINRDKKIVAWNRAIEEMTGTPKEEMLGQGDYAYALPFYGKRRPILIDLVGNEELDGRSRYPHLTSTDGVLRAESYVRTAYNGKGAFLWGIAVPFFDSDGNWIGAVESIRDITDRRQAEEELKERTQKLEETNTALKVLLRESSETKEDLENKVVLNVKKLVRPYLDNLEVISTSHSQKMLIGTIKTNLDQVASSFSKKISSEYLGLTPREIQIADLIRQGKVNKEIAELLKVSTSAVEFHRRNLRHKLKIKGEKVNLRSYLLSLAG